MDLLLLCGQPQPIGVDAPSLLCSAPSIMLCGEVQHVGANMPILIHGAQAPCAKGLLNPSDDAHHGFVHRVAGECLSLDGPWRMLVFVVDEVDGRGGTLVGWYAWKRWMCYRLRLLPPCVAPRFMCNIVGWRETGEEMAGNGGVFIIRHQLMETMYYIAHTLIWLTVTFVLPNHKQFILVNCMMFIAHAFIWLPISFVLPHRKQLIELNCMPLIAHATKI